jgi:hypothetical protein
MKYGGFSFLNLNNIGDQIQSIAAEQFLPQVDVRLNRDTLSTFTNKEQLLLIMNGWFSHTPERCFPPSKNIEALFWGFHVTDWNNSWEYVLKSQSLKYLKKNEPIGCRDQITMNRLKENGITSFYSKCLTLTFPKRTLDPKDGWNILVDAQHLPIPDKILSRSINLSHKVPNNLPEKMKFIYARYLLNLYKENARLVITTRLHCALPCIAMGIPVVFFGDENDYRISILKDLGLEINHIKLKDKKDYAAQTKHDLIFNYSDFQQKVNWNPVPLEFEDEKKKMINDFKAMLSFRCNLLINKH